MEARPKDATLRCMTITHGGPPVPHVTIPRPRPPAFDSLRTPKKTAITAVAAPRVRLGHQAVIVAAAVAAYFLVRGATEAAYADALRNAHTLVDLERLLGFYWEPALQEALVGSPRVTTALNGIYIYGHWPVIVASLLWLGSRHPAIYFRVRNAMLLSGAIGLVVFVSYPVAPPRLAGLGMTDTVTAASDAYRVLQPTLFTNQYAALPSLHVGWDLLIGLGLAAALIQRPLLRALALAMPVAMVVAVVLTANHYIVDAVAGAALTTACWLVVGRWAGPSRAAAADGVGKVDVRQVHDVGGHSRVVDRDVRDDGGVVGQVVDGDAGVPARAGPPAVGFADPVHAGDHAGGRGVHPRVDREAVVRRSVDRADGA